MKEFLITGMSCGHCAAHVKEALLSVDGVTDARVDLDDATAMVSGDFDNDEVIAAVEEAGYEAELI